MDAALAQKPVKKSKRLWLWICVILSIAALSALAVFAFNTAGNSYKTPIAIAAEQANDKAYKNDVVLLYNALNGFASAEAARVLELVTATDGYQQSLEEEQWFFDEAVGFNKKAYGEDWQLKFKVAAKEKLGAAALVRYSEMLQAKAAELDAVLSEDTALQDSLLAYAAQLRTAEVSAGYILTVKKVMTGSKLTEPEVEETPITVYKINGRWIMEETPISFATEAVRYATKG